MSALLDALCRWKSGKRVLLRALRASSCAEGLSRSAEAAFPMKVDISEKDVKAIESLCDAAARAEGYQAALEGWALVLRLRDALGMKPETHVLGRG